MTTDNKVKSIAKTISYILSHYTLQFIAVFLFTKNTSLSISIILIEMAIETVYYYIHERAWSYASKRIARRKHKHHIIDELV